MTDQVLRDKLHILRSTDFNSICKIPPRQHQDYCSNKHGTAVSCVLRQGASVESCQPQRFFTFFQSRLQCLSMVPMLGPLPRDSGFPVWGTAQASSRSTAPHYPWPYCDSDGGGPRILFWKYCSTVVYTNGNFSNLRMYQPLLFSQVLPCSIFTTNKGLIPSSVRFYRPREIK